VFTLHSMMLVLLGVLLATLVVIIVAPAYRRRVMRLTSDRIRQAVPLTEAEIRADKDRLRAQYAIRVHKLEAQSEQQKISAARQRIEMNRRDARIADLESDIEKVRASLEEHVNARRVLEHTVTDRLPRLEQQLESARGLIGARDKEMSGLKAETLRSVRALDEAMQINAQQRAEIDRLKNSIVGRGAFAGDLRGDSGMEGEIALRSEIEALRLRTREQAQLIARLQMSAASNVRASEGGSDGASDTDRLLRELADAQAALASIKDTAGSGDAERAAAKAEVASLRQQSEAQASEIAQLKAALATYEGQDETGGGVRDSRLVTKARVSALQAQVASQNETIVKLRAEVAASNERLARQAQQYMAEMRRLGSGTVATSAETRRARNGQSRDVLSDRINRARNAGLVEVEADGTEGQTSSKVADYIKRLPTDALPGGGKAADPGPSKSSDAAHAAKLEVVAGASPNAAEASSDRPAEHHGRAGAPETPKRKPRLLERISGIGKA
jgi:chromosome segregation ATPase